MSLLIEERLYGLDFLLRIKVKIRLGHIKIGEMKR